MKPTLLKLAAAGALAVGCHAADFSYYMLSLSYAPEYCGHPDGKQLDARECGVGRPAFVVHGLWPENNNGRSPENCGPARPVPVDIVRKMLSYFPTESLVKYEWATHGTCSGLTPGEYFAAVQRTRDSVRIPPRLEQLTQRLIASPMEIETEFAQANPGIPRDGIRTACYPDAGLREIRFCFDKTLTPHACTGATDCTKLSIRLSPPPRKPY
jgi:ribonuclease T2